MPFVALLWCPILKSSRCNLFEDGAPVDEIYGSPIIKYVTEGLQSDSSPIFRSSRCNLFEDRSPADNLINPEHNESFVF